MAYLRTSALALVHAQALVNLCRGLRISALDLHNYFITCAFAYFRVFLLLCTSALPQVLAHFRMYLPTYAALTHLRMYLALAYLRISALAYLRKYLHTYASTCALMLLQMYLRTHTSTCAFAHFDTHTLAHVLAHFRTCALAHLRTHILTHLRMYLRTCARAQLLTHLCKFAHLKHLRTGLLYF